VTGDTGAVRDEVADMCEGPTLLIHDAAHEEDAVLADLRLYAPLVTPGRSRRSSASSRRPTSSRSTSRASASC